MYIYTYMYIYIYIYLYVGVSKNRGNPPHAWFTTGTPISMKLQMLMGMDYPLMSSNMAGNSPKSGHFMGIFQIGT